MKVAREDDRKATRWDGLPKGTKTSQIREIKMKQYAKQLLENTESIYKISKPKIDLSSYVSQAS